MCFLKQSCVLLCRCTLLLWHNLVQHEHVSVHRKLRTRLWPVAKQHLNQLTSSGTVESTQGQRHTGVTPIALERGPSAGCLSIEKLSAVALPDAVSIGAMDLEAEYVTICNLSSSEVSLDGWALFSARGQQRHLLPNDVVLKSGEKLVVWSGPRADGGHDTPGVQHLVWSGRNMWNGMSPLRNRRVVLLSLL